MPAAVSHCCGYRVDKLAILTLDETSDMRFFCLGVVGYRVQQVYCSEHSQSAALLGTTLSVGTQIRTYLHLPALGQQYLDINMDFAPSKQEVNEDVEYVLIGAGEKVARC